MSELRDTKGQVRRFFCPRGQKKRFGILGVINSDSGRPGNFADEYLESQESLRKWRPDGWPTARQGPGRQKSYGFGPNPPPPGSFFLSPFVFFVLTDKRSVSYIQRLGFI